MTIAPLSPSEIVRAIQERRFDRQNLREIDLSQQDLVGADLSGVNAIGIDLSRSNLAGANLQGADLRRADLNGANFQGANLKDCFLFRADLRGCHLTGADLTDAKVKLARYDDRTLWPEGFNHKSSGAIGPGANLSGMFLNAVSLRGADLSNCNLRGTYLSGADLTEANLTGAALSGANLQNAFLTGACLRNAKLIGAELKGADLRAADLTDANLEQLANIAGADFTLAQGLTDAMKSMLRGHSPQELGTWNSHTRTSTAHSLGFN